MLFIYLLCSLSSATLTLPEWQKWHSLIFSRKTSRSLRRVLCETDSSCKMAAYEEVHHTRFRFTDFRSRSIYFPWTRAMLEELYLTLKPPVSVAFGWSLVLNCRPLKDKFPFSTRSRSESFGVSKILTLLSWDQCSFVVSFFKAPIRARRARWTTCCSSWGRYILAYSRFSVFPPQTAPKTANTWGNKLRCFGPCE